MHVQKGFLGSFLVSISAALLLSACVEFKPIALYTGDEQEPLAARPAYVGLVVEPEIFRESARDVWGLEKNDCQTANLTTAAAYSGTQSIAITWNRGNENCTWAGIGIGWDAYAGKDLTEIMAYGAVEFYVRAQEGRMFNLPFVLTLEDYSGGMGFCYTSNSYFERAIIDEEWQRVVVPLRDFDIRIENLDVTNIKQLQIELQQSGSVYLDDIKLILHEPTPQEPWMVEEKLPDPTAMPIQIFDDNFIYDNGWGLISDRCQQITYTTEQKSVGERAIHAKWDNTLGDCNFTAFGASWNKWRPVDVRPVKKSAGIQFDIKMISTTGLDKLSMRVGLEDYDQKKSTVTLQSSYTADGGFTTTWTSVTVPFGDLPDEINFGNVKQVYFGFDGRGEVYIDNIRLVEL